MAGNSAPLDDPALNNELEALLAVEPSAGFNARVLAEATARPRWALPWQLAPAGALAVALAVALVIHFGSAGPTALPLTGRPFASPIAFAPQLPAKPAIATDPISVPAMPRSRAARHLRPEAQAQSTGPAVLVAMDESRALGQLFARLRPLQVASATDDSPLPLSADAPAAVRPLLVPLLVIDPLQSSEDPPGGVSP